MELDLNEISVAELLNKVKSHEEEVAPLRVIIRESEQSIQEESDRLEELLEEASKLKASITKEVKRKQSAEEELKLYEDESATLQHILSLISRAIPTAISKDI